jgi:hypothetical protein
MAAGQRRRFFSVAPLVRNCSGYVAAGGGPANDEASRRVGTEAGCVLGGLQINFSINANMLWEGRKQKGPYPFRSIVTVLVRRRKFILRSQSIIDIHDYQTQFAHQRLTQGLLSRQSSNTPSSAMIEDCQWTTMNRRDVGMVRANSNLVAVPHSNFMVLLRHTRYGIVGILRFGYDLLKGNSYRLDTGKGAEVWEASSRFGSLNKIVS